MPFSGGTYTKARDFTTDQSAGVNPSALNFDQVIDDMSTALSQTFLRDGTVSMTGDVAFGSHALSGVTTLGMSGDLTININKFTVNAASGNVIAAGTLGVTGDLTVNTNKFTVNAASGNVGIAGTLGVTGDVAINTNKFTVNASSGNLVAAGTMGVAGDFAVNTNKFTVNAASGNVVAAGTVKSANAYGSIAGSVAVAINGSSRTAGTVYAMVGVSSASVTISSANVTATVTTGDTSFTIAQAGVYQILANCCMATSTGFASNAVIGLAKNGSLGGSAAITGQTSLVSNYYSTYANGVQVPVSLSCISSLAANDVIRITFTVAATSNVTAVMGGFSVRLLEPA